MVSESISLLSILLFGCSVLLGIIGLYWGIIKQHLPLMLISSLFLCASFLGIMLIGMERII